MWSTSMAKYVKGGETSARLVKHLYEVARRGRVKVSFTPPSIQLGNFCLHAGCANNMACEEQVDAYLNSYCKSALPSTVTAGPTVTVTTTHASTTITETATVTTVSTTSITTTSTKTVYSTCSPSGECNLSGTNSTALLAPSTASQKPTLVLGALLGLCIVALLIVTTGWIWTYSVLKRNARTDDNSQRLK